MGKASDMIEYSLSFEQYGQHLIDVEMRFLATAQQTLWLPVWIPGSYLVREFARHLGQVTVQTADGKPCRIEKNSKNMWQIDCQDQEQLIVRYQVYAFDLSVRGAYVDHTRLYINPACVCLAVGGQESSEIQVQVVLGVAFNGLPIATTLPTHKQASGYVLSALHYDDLIDHPFEVASLTEVAFEAADIHHRVAISGRHKTNMLRLKEDLQKICQTQVAFFGQAPFEHYLFMVMATGQSYGGLEHQDCTSLITPRDDLPRSDEAIEPSAAYRRFLGLCSHEYFHAWLVKYIRPEPFVKPNLHQEAYTTLLWIFEGFTSYYDDLFLLRSGVISQDAYLELLAEQISRYQQNAGRMHQSLSESSFDAWIKYYRPDENTNNAGTSYYNKGALVALCLDLTLRQAGSSLDALMTCLFERAKKGVAVNAHTLPEICFTLIGDSLPDFWRSYVDGLDELPLDTLLQTVGVRRVADSKTWPFGMKLGDAPNGVVVQQVLRDSVAARAGISAQDVIVALDGLRANVALITQYAERSMEPERSNPTVECHLFRRDELNVLRLRTARHSMAGCRLQVQDEARLNPWLSASD